MGAVEGMFAGEPGEDVGRLDKRLAQVLAVTKNEQRVMDQRSLAIEAAKQLWRSRRGQTFEQIQRSIRIGCVAEQRGNRCSYAGRDTCCDSIQVRMRTSRVSEINRCGG